MCLGIPVKVLKIIDENTALVDAEGVKVDVSTMLVENIETGNYVLVHAGFIIEKLSKEDVSEKQKLLKEYRDKINNRDIK